MPVEFSGAAYRFGHSMVRDNYVIATGPAAVSVFGPARPARRHARRRRSSAAASLPPALEIDWRTFFTTSPMRPERKHADRPLPGPAAAPRATRPDAARGAQPDARRQARVAGRAAVATKMDVPPLSADHLLSRWSRIATRPATAKVLASTPLWYYVLCEANSPAGSTGATSDPSGADRGGGARRPAAGRRDSYLRRSPPGSPLLRPQGDDSPWPTLSATPRARRRSEATFRSPSAWWPPASPGRRRRERRSGRGGAVARGGCAWALGDPGSHACTP